MRKTKNCKHESFSKFGVGYPESVMNATDALDVLF